ncbi:MAG: pyridoxal phosphate-dependent aminotransferase [Oligoflexia bacterium]|nr:pyridoxal phosphate-dependent aminotransferase [Oligoflexia bacterium]
MPGPLPRPGAAPSGPALAQRLQGIAESATLRLNAKAMAMKAQGIDVINLTAGEPDFNAPEAAKEAVIEAVRRDRSKYTPAPGIPELREAIARKTLLQQPSLAARQPWTAENVIVTNGGKHALFNAFMALLDPGDELLIPSPYWLSYPEMAKIAGAVPKFIEAPLSQGFKITPEQLRSALGPRAKALVLNSPCNPTGAVYSKREYRALADVLLTTPGAEGLWVVSDEIYDRITFGTTPFCSFLEAAPELRERVITVNGMSKSAAMTGWRVGWSVAPAAATRAMLTLQGQCTSNINSLAQYAALAALPLPESDFAAQVESFRRRRDLCLDILGRTGKIDWCTPEGAFYLFVGVARCLRPGESSFALAERLLQEAKVAVVPGTPFGGPGYLRLSYSIEEKALREGCERIVRYLES